MNRIFVWLLIIALPVVLTSCTPEIMQLTVENPSDFDRSYEMVEIPVEDIQAKVTLTGNEVYVVKDVTGSVVPSQITHDGKLIFQSQLKLKETRTFTIQSGKIQAFEPKTFGRYIPERKEDFAWENDRVAFRIYGQALIPIDGPSNGLDVWYKRTDKLVIDRWYKDDLAGVASYHNDNGEGLDDYKVGRSLGAGAMAPYANDKLWLNENYVSHEVLENGPLRTTFKLTYKDIEVDGKTYAETRAFSLDAGSQLTKVIQEYRGLQEAIPVASGIVKREQDSVIVSQGNDYIIYVEPFSEVVDNVYLGVVFPDKFERSVTDTYTITHDGQKKNDMYSHVLLVTTYQPDKPVTYYTGYGWSKYGFSSLTAFQQYIDRFTQALKQPLILNY
ncbi:hypothetical protein EZS27_012364 [termite gut metagenome]|uniref:DUF4861 domain-containing protein n=1 Tax=termite gut metagenome TaxID=433724 RepID=A0A5J4S1X6_9ZZZZ